MVAATTTLPSGRRTIANIDFDYIEKNRANRGCIETLLVDAMGLRDDGGLKVDYIRGNYNLWSSSERGLAWVAVALYRGSASDATAITGDGDGFGRAIRNCSGRHAEALLHAIALYMS